MESAGERSGEKMKNKLHSSARSRFSSLIAAMMPFLIALGTSGSAAAAPRSHIGRDQRVMVLCVKFSDVSTTRKRTCRDWVDTLNVEVNDYYLSATGGRTSFTFVAPGTGPADGWFQLSRPSTAPFFFDEIRDEVMPLAAAANVDFTGADRFLVVTNSPAFFGMATGQADFLDWMVARGAERVIIANGAQMSIRSMTGVVIHEWLQGGSRIDWASINVIHELGHALGSCNHYASPIIGGVPQPALDQWTVMGLHMYVEPAHFTAFDKADRQWLPPGTTVTIEQPRGAITVDQTITLRTHESQDPGAVHQILLPLHNGLPVRASAGYTVEARQTSLADNVQESGIVVARYDSTGRGGNSIINYFVERDTTSDGALNHSALEPGDQFVDRYRNLVITHVANPSPGVHVVRIQWGTPLLQQADPMLLAGPGPAWDSPDVWIDSERNGWGNYRNVDAIGNPVGSGDDPWVSDSRLGLLRPNRVYARIRNPGIIAATNVAVNFYSANANIGLPSSGWQLIDRVVIPTISAGGVFDAYVNWLVFDPGPASVLVVVEPYPNEISDNNNSAQENVWATELARVDAMPLSRSIHLYNPSDKFEVLASIVVQDLGPGWTYELAPLSQRIPAGSSADFQLRFRPPSGLLAAGTSAKAQVTALVRGDDSLVPVGGAEVWTQIVEPTSLTCDRSTTAQGTRVSGRLTPAVGGETVAVEIVRQGTRHLRLSRTAPDGSFSAAFDVVADGSAAVSFSGGTTLGSSTRSCP